MNQLKVSISKGNVKMGMIPSVSLPAVITCNPNAPCFKKCYALRIARRYKQSKAAYQNNLDILNNNELEYWHQIMDATKMTKFFRYHVSGDIPDVHYFNFMCSIASAIPTTKFLAFTKQYEIVNHALNSGLVIPDNLKIIFSNWGSWKCENPHNLPVCEIILKGNKPEDHWKICGGNCSDCACAGIGCWELKNGETIAIYEH